MAATQNKHSFSRAQGSRLPVHAATQPEIKPNAKTRKRPRKHQIPSRLPKPIVSKHGKTTVRRYASRRFHRMEEVKGKTVDFVEIFTSGEYHSLDIRFQDQTALHFVIDPGFTLDTEYCDWKTGNLRRIKRWPLIRSQSLRA